MTDEEENYGYIQIDSDVEDMIDRLAWIIDKGEYDYAEELLQKFKSDVIKTTIESQKQQNKDDFDRQFVELRRCSLLFKTSDGLMCKSVSQGNKLPLIIKRALQTTDYTTETRPADIQLAVRSYQYQGRDATGIPIYEEIQND